MASIESLKQQLKDLLILNHGDIRITEYPNLVSDGRELELNLGQLNQLIQQVYAEIDWRPYEIINNKLELIFRKGILSTDQFEEIVSLVSDSVNRNIVEQYVVAELSKRDFKPREINHADPLSIQNKWMTDLVWEEYKESLIEVEWLGQKASSLSKLGDISFNNKDDAKYFLRNGNYLPGLVTALSKSATKADEFARIIEDEFDSEKKYLRIIYRLNPRLPFLFQGKKYLHVLELLQDACSTPELYNALLESYRKGEMQIWIEESDPVIAFNLGTQYNLNSFLRFLYKTDPKLPFFLNQNRYLTPEELTEHAKRDFSIWPGIADSITDKNINEWFTGIGKEDWNDQIINSRAYISETGYYSADEVNLALVQALFYIIDPLSGKPKLEINPDEIQLLTVKGGIPIKQTININLKNQGFINVKVYFKFLKDGITLSDDVLKFNSLEGNTIKSIDVNIDTSLLPKDQLYQLELVISSIYEDVIVPVKIKVVFPQKEYVLKLVQYSIITALYFGGFRYLLGLFLDYDGWLVNSQFVNSSDIISKAPLLSFFVFVLFITGCLFSFKLIKKIEKI